MEGRCIPSKRSGKSSESRVSESVRSRRRHSRSSAPTRVPIESDSSTRKNPEQSGFFIFSDSIDHPIYTATVSSFFTVSVSIDGASSFVRSRSVLSILDAGRTSERGRDDSSGASGTSIDSVRDSGVDFSGAGFFFGPPSSLSRSFRTWSACSFSSLRSAASV